MARASAFSCLVAGALITGGAHAAPQRLVATATVGANGSVSCSATSASITRSSPLIFDFTCLSGPRFRCDLDGDASYTVSSTTIDATCFALTEIPAGDPAGLIFASGFEG